MLCRPLVLLSADAMNRRNAQGQRKCCNSDSDHGTNNAGEALGARLRPQERGVMDVVLHDDVWLQYTSLASDVKKKDHCTPSACTRKRLSSGTYVMRSRAARRMSVKGMTDRTTVKTGVWNRRLEMNRFRPTGGVR